jgi:deazaflavin-dependent oxidoreductase (nitroreductase family)
MLSLQEAHMANTPQEIDTNKLRADPRVINQLNQAVIKEFRANQGKVVGLLEETPDLQALASKLDILGQPLLLLTMAGAKTGRTLVRPVCYSRDGHRLVIIASRGGDPRNPPWYYNLVANPVVIVEVGTEKFKAKATQVYGAERDRLFAEAAKRMPLFAEYQNKTKRQIPLLVLTRIEGEE